MLKNYYLTLRVLIDTLLRFEPLGFEATVIMISVILLHSPNPAWAMVALVGLVMALLLVVAGLLWAFVTYNIKKKT